MRKGLFLAAGAVLACGVIRAGQLKPTMVVPLKEKVAVEIDGVADEAAWKGATVLTHLVSPYNSSPAGAQTAVRVLADAEALYLTVRSDLLPSSSRPKGRFPRDKGLHSDVIETHFKSKAEDKCQYQITFDAAGNIWDNRNTFDTTPNLMAYQRVKYDGKWTAEGMTSAAKSEKDFWTFEVRIPWSAFGMSAPQDGQSMLANFCHADYGNGVAHNQLCEWAVDPYVQFADWRNWGTLVFRRDTAVVTAAEIVPGGKTAKVTVKAGAKPFEGSLRIDEDAGTTELESRLDEKLSVPVGEGRSFEFPLKRQSTLAWLTVEDADGKAIFRRYGRPAGTILMVKMQDRLNVRKRHIKIPNDATWYNPFHFSHTLTGKTGNKVYGNPPELDAHFHVEVPEGVEVPHVKYSDWGGDMPIEKPLAVTPTVRDGKPYRKYEFRCFISGVNKPLVFFRSTLPSGTKGNAYLYLTWKTGAEEPVAYPFEIVSFGRVRPFERMQMRLDDITPNLARAMSDDPAAELPTLGINVWKIPLQASKNAAFDAKLVEAMRASTNKWYFCVQNELNNIGWWVNKFKWGDNKDVSPDEAGLFRNIDGEPVRTQFSYYAPCLMYRGRNYRRTVADTLASEAVKNWGVTWLILDWEFWGEEPCYCDHCVKDLWPKYATDHGLAEPGDPRVFMRDEKANARPAALFRQFYAECKGKLYADFKRDLNAGLDPARVSWNAPKTGGFVLSDWISPRQHTKAAMDFFDWPFAYRPPWQKLDETDAQLTDVLNGRGDQVVCSLNAMQGCEFNQEFPPVATYYNMIEAAAMGVRGFEWWYAPVIDAETYWYIMRGLRMIRPFEDLVLDGQTTVRGTEADCTWRRVARDGEALYCVRNYALKEPKDVTFTVDASVRGSVWDAETGEKLADLAPSGATAVKVRLAPDRLARLLYAGEKLEFKSSDARLFGLK